MVTHSHNQARLLSLFSLFVDTRLDDPGVSVSLEGSADITSYLPSESLRSRLSD